MKLDIRNSFFSKILSIILLISISSCRSSDKAQEFSEPKASSGSEPKVVDEKDSLVPSKILKKQTDPQCAQRPEVTMCCKALLPACEECQQNNMLAQEKWEKSCLESTAFIDCKLPPKITGCCSDPEEKCQTCRQDAIAHLSDYKDKCGSYSPDFCQQKPQLATCETTKSPSALRCDDRNARVLELWQQTRHKK